MSEKVRWGIIGTGDIANQFAHDLKLLDKARLVGIGSRTRERAESFGERYGIPHRHGSYESLVRDPEIDIVYVATPHPFHKADTLLCLENGKAVLCEKPIAMNGAEAEEMAALAREKDRFLAEALPTYFYPAIRKAKDLIADGAIGEVRLVKADLCFCAEFDPDSRLFRPDLGGGSLLDVGIYSVALAYLAYGKAPESVQSTVRIGETGVDEQCAVLLRYAGGAFALLTAGIRLALPQDAVIAGTGGVIKLERFSQPDSVVLERNGEKETHSYKRLGYGYTFEATEVMKDWEAGRLESRMVPLETSLAIMRTLDRIRSAWDSTPGEKERDTGKQ